MPGYADTRLPRGLAHGGGESKRRDFRKETIGTQKRPSVEDYTTTKGLRRTPTHPNGLKAEDYAYTT